MKRRHFLKAIGWGLGGGSLLCLGRGATAAGINPGLEGQSVPVLVVVFQRGGMDGLLAVPPLRDRNLPKMRPNLTMKARDGLKDLDGDYGLHPAFSALYPSFKDGSLAVLHGVGLPSTARSHFDAQDYMETGTPGRKGTPDGWLNRLSARLTGSSPLKAVAFSAATPRAMMGDGPAFTLEHLDQFKRFARTAAPAPGASPLFQKAALQSQALQQFHDRIWPATSAGARYPRGDLGSALRQAAQLIKAKVGVQLILVNSEGWDTHRGQGTVRGAFSRAATPLAESLAAFRQDLGGDWERVLTLTMTEFGRTVKENGSGGTDHGRGSCFFAMGAGVWGGRVFSKVPELKTANLAEGRDLPVSCDFRAVLTPVVEKHFGLKPDQGLFPGWSGPSLGFLKG